MAGVPGGGFEEPLQALSCIPSLQRQAQSFRTSKKSRVACFTPNKSHFGKFVLTAVK